MAGYTNMNANFTTTSGLSPAMQTYYNRTLLRNFEPNLVHLQFGDVHPMPLNNGKIMNMRKLTPIPEKTTELSEGNPGDGILMAETEVTVELKQYGDHAEFSDKFDMANLDWNLSRKVDLFGKAGARSIDIVAREELAKIPNVIYAGAKSSRETLTATDKLSTVELRKAVRFLKKSHAETFNGYYVAIVGPDTVYDLQDDDRFVKVSEYQDKENIYTGEVGRLFGVRLVETTQAKIFEGAGSSGADVASIVVLGQGAYGVTSWKGSKPRVIVKGPGSAGTADPLDQISSVGWKCDGIGIKALQPEFAVRIECGFSA